MTIPQVPQSALDAELNTIKNNATKILLVAGYTVGDSYATIVANSVASATISSADFTLASSGNNRTLTFNGKTGTATAAITALATGTATSGTATTLNDTTKSFTAGALVNKVVTITGGTGVGQKAVITANTATQVSFAALTTAPDATSTYRITPDTAFVFTDGTASWLWETDETSNQTCNSGDTITFPALTYTANQPT